MSRIFLSTSFTSSADQQTGQIEAEFRKSLEQILDNLRAIDGVTVFCAVEYENWQVSNEPPEVSIKKDIHEIRESDILIALIPSQGAIGGVHFEIGIAYALGKQVFVATESDTQLGFFNQGAVNAGYIKHIRYTNPAALAEQVRDVL